MQAAGRAVVSRGRCTMCPRGAEEEPGQHDPDDLSQEWRRLLAEFFDTFALTPVAAGATALDSRAGGKERQAATGS